ncbi:hypothetical protein HCN_1409 [Helicobacter cinaedi PAGU611]|uniref:hypothetical protein n=1 Tax=Helicobacter cinaedi TaxID=213 RepID=UPI00025D3697|nr:hypothetical protein [Helicobacter cinaedi]BAM12613.1 hypothetical protein HCN_1409 [Helicobacter cinaedi PAGU611]
MNKYRTLYKALPFCIEDKENQDILEKENIYKTYTYKSNFAKIVLSDDNEEFFNAKEKQIINLLYDEECKSLYLANQNSEIQATFNPMSSTIYIDTQTKELYLFANDKDFIDCDTIYEQIKQELKLQESIEELQSYKPSLFFYSTLLLGSSEIETNPFFFGTPDTKSNIGLDESKPIYHFSPKDEENNLGTLTIFLNSCTLTLLNYSLLDSSLNIKLECNSKESKAILEKEQTQREQIQRDSNSIDSLTSTAMLHPLLEDNEIKCPHNGVVQLQSNKGKSITDKNIPFILESDLLNSPIIGCTNNIAGVPTPCTQVALILPNARGLKKYNDDYPIMQDLVSSGVMSDKGFPLICTPKPNSYKINAPSPTHTKNRDKEALKTQIEFHKPILRLHYKEHKSQQDNLPITQFYLFDNLKEQTSPFENLILDYQSDAQSMSDKNLEKELLQSYSNKEYQHKQINLQFGIHQIHLVFIIPQYLPKLFKEPYKDYEHKDYGIGQYKPLLNYSKDIKEYRESTHSKDTSLQSISITHTRVFLSPFKANKLHFTFALGLDDYLDKDNTTELKIIIGGVYDEGEIESDLVATLASNDDRLEYEALEDTKEEKQITEIYFSYGEDKIKLKDISRHSQDINLHIRTQGYEEGEIIKVKLESSTNQTFIVRGRIQNNEAFIMNVLKEIEEER